MTSTHPLRRPSRTLRRTMGLVVAGVVLGGSLTACGSEAQNTTCGELKGKSVDDKLSFFEDAAKDDGGDGGDALLEQLDALPDDEATRKAAADNLTETACGGKDDDTKLKDTPLYG